MQDSIFSLFELYIHMQEGNIKLVLFALPPNYKEEFSFYVVLLREVYLLLIRNIGKNQIIRMIFSTIKSYVTKEKSIIQILFYFYSDKPTN